MADDDDNDWDKSKYAVNKAATSHYEAVVRPSTEPTGHYCAFRFEHALFAERRAGSNKWDSNTYNVGAPGRPGYDQLAPPTVLNYANTKSPCAGVDGSNWNADAYAV